MEVAEATTPGPWDAVKGATYGWWVELLNLADVAIDLHGENAQHIAAFDPPTVLALLDEVAGAEADYILDPEEGP